MLHSVYLLAAMGATANAHETTRFGIDAAALCPYMLHSTS